MTFHLPFGPPHRPAIPLLCAILLLGFAALSATPTRAQERLEIEERVAGMETLEGYFDLYWDAEGGALYWEIDKLDTEFLYQVSMGSGLGSNPVGIDRGQLRGTYVLRAERVGPRVLLVEPNYRYRATSPNAPERRAVTDAFAPSVHWGFDIVAESEDRVLVDATAFFLRDARNVVGQLKQRGQGDFSLDAERSALYLENTRTFPENIEIEAMLTFVSGEPGPLVQAVAATGNAVTLRQHHSIVKLPDAGYEPRIADPRIGTLGPTIQDYGTAIDEDRTVRLVARHRLQKKNPSAARSEAVEPIVYYVDPGVPEPIKSALIEGAAWWNDAFEAAGFIDAFQVKELPPGADAQDVRYNMIHWTHRRTRGYSYGGSVRDPRTGEIIKGNVNLGSLRLRQDYLLGQGLVPAFAYLADASADPSASVEMALARVRQLSAHEVGHTLGFPHNYLASTYGRESVMDYPAPLVKISEEGAIDLSDAYLPRIGEYDKLAVRYAYEQFPEGADERTELNRIVQESLDRGLIFMAHKDNNFRGAGHPTASVWDNGANLVDHLAHEFEVRRIGLERFGLETIRTGEPVSNLETVLLPLYMHHRFQMNAAAQSIGGADYRNALRGDGQQPFAILDGAEQRRALEVVLRTLEVEFLALPERILALLPPPAERHDQGEMFPGRTGLLFDPLGAAEASASLTLQTILHPARMERLVAYGSLGPYPDLGEVVDAILDATWKAPKPESPYHRQIQQTVQRTTVDELLALVRDSGSSGAVRGVIGERLDALRRDLEPYRSSNAHVFSVVTDLDRWRQSSDALVPAQPLAMPAGDPI